MMFALFFSTSSQETAVLPAQSLPDECARKAIPMSVAILSTEQSVGKRKFADWRQIRLHPVHATGLLRFTFRFERSGRAFVSVVCCLPRVALPPYLFLVQ